MYPPESLPRCLFPFALCLGSAWMLRTKPSIVSEVDLFLPELARESLGDSHVLRNCCEGSHRGGQDVTGAHCFVCVWFPRAMTSSRWNCLLGWSPGHSPEPEGPPTLPLSLHWSSGSRISGLTDWLFHLFLDGVDHDLLSGVCTPFPDILQQQGVSGQPVQWGHQQLSQAKPPALFVLLTPLGKAKQTQSECHFSYRGPEEPKRETPSEILLGSDMTQLWACWGSL